MNEDGHALLLCRWQNERVTRQKRQNSQRGIPSAQLQHKMATRRVLFIMSECGSVPIGNKAGKQTGFYAVRFSCRVWLSLCGLHQSLCGSCGEVFCVLTFRHAMQSEAAHPYHEMVQAGYSVTFATPHGRPAPVEKASVPMITDSQTREFLKACSACT